MIARRHAILILVFLSLFFDAGAQDKESITTFILVRHAEKVNDGTKDPDLSSDGYARSERLAHTLSGSDIAAIYSTDYKRTRNTASPIATRMGVGVQLYSPKDASFLSTALSKHIGGTILVVGHSNTVPLMANMLLGKEVLKDFAETVYGDLLIISVIEVGEGKMIRLTY